MPSKAPSGSTAGYSGTPLPRKLGIKAGHHVLILGGPDDLAAKLGELPPSVKISRTLRGKQPADVILLFCGSRTELERRFDGARQRLATDGGLWVAWPKKSSGVATDLSDGVVRDFGLSTGLVDNKVCAIDETWSGLRFVIRVKDRK